MERTLVILMLLWSTAAVAGEAAPRPTRPPIQLPRLAAAPGSWASTRGPGALLPGPGKERGRTAVLQQLAGQAPRPPRQPKGRGVWRPALVASAAAAVTGAAVAYWSTGEADAAYDRYLRSAGARRQQQAFERAERYDRIAGAAFLAMEAGIVLTACLVFL